MKKALLLFFTFVSFPAWTQPVTPNPDMWVTNQSPRGIFVDGDYTYIWGDFSFVGPNTGCGAKLTTTSTSPNLVFPKVDNTIYAVVPDGNGGWYIGGSFTSVGGIARNRLAQINADGSVSPWNPNVGGTVTTIAVSGSDIYVGGSFTTINGTTTRNRLAKLNNTDGTADATWNPNAGSSVYAIAISGSDIYVGGAFTTINGATSRSRLAKLNTTDGTTDATWNPNAAGSVYAIAITGSDIYVGGSFTTINGATARNRLAKLNNTTGTADGSWNPNAASTVLTIVLQGSDIYIGGLFTTINGGTTRNRIAKLNNTDGIADAAWNPNASGTCSTIVAVGSDIYVGGQFTTIGGQERNYLARLNNTDGNADATWIANAGGVASSIAVNGSDIYVGGQFKSVGGQIRNRLAKLNNLDGTLENTWNPNANNTVYEFFKDGNDIYVAGTFTSIGGLARCYFARVNSTGGAVDATFNAGVPDNGTAWPGYGIIVDGNSVYVSGLFLSIGGQSRKYMAKLNKSDGSLDLSFNPDPNASPADMIIDGNDMYVGGTFSSIGGLTRQAFARINKYTGAADPGWNANVLLGASGGWQADEGLVLTSTHLYISGNFDKVGGLTRKYLARINKTDGSVDPTWDPNPDNIVFPICFDGNVVYVGGNFTTIAGKSIAYLAKLSAADGSVDTTWNPAPNSTIVAITKNGLDLYIGGFYTKMGISPQPYFALFTERALPVELVSLTAQAKRSSVILSWQTATEVNSYGFEVERMKQSTNSSAEWRKIGFLAGHLNSNSPKSYTFTDANLSPGKYYYRLKMIDTDGSYEYSDKVEADMRNIPSDFSLGQNYPNPFNPSTAIRFGLPEESKVTLEVMNIIGERVAMLVNDMMPAGHHTVEFNAANLPSGIYTCRLQAGSFTATRKMVLIR